MGRTMLSRAYQELLQLSDIVMTSDLDWTIVRFSAPTDGPARGVKRYGILGTDKVGMRVTRADIDAFTAAQLTDDRYQDPAPPPSATDIESDQFPARSRAPFVVTVLLREAKPGTPSFLDQLSRITWRICVAQLICYTEGATRV